MLLHLVFGIQRNVSKRHDAVTGSCQGMTRQRQRNLREPESTTEGTQKGRQDGGHLLICTVEVDSLGLPLERVQ